MKANKNSKITIIPNSWDFGEVKEGEVKNKIFTVKNIGDENLIIKSIYTNCGCTTAEISSKKIAPQEATELKVAYNSKGKSSGKDSKEIYIVSNDPINPKAKITITTKIVVPQAGHTDTESNSTKIPTITSEELIARLEKEEKIIILDVREENEYLERHIPQSIWFPKSKFDKGDERTEGIVNALNKNLKIVAYCGAGHRSSYVTRKLRQSGYDAYNLEGVSFWEKKGYPLIRGPKLPSSQEPSPVYLEEAYEHYYKLFKDIVWIDVRTMEDYKKGHVKGALGIPLSELEDNFQRIPKDKEIVFYCEGTWDGGKCDSSMSAGRILIKNGFKPGKIKVFEDGYGAWENAGYPMGKGGESDD